MNNKTLAIFGITPVALSFLTGVFEGLTETQTDGTFYMFLGVIMLIFIPWGLVRLYKTPDKQ